ncbi:NAD(P)/FAD-dependent oxidoreductase [Caballeronia sordidicola]|uniref:NAD(P)/FAD-dependent oxidoreductase n=1 Tax=Caballeronia sordidicola TaxID=196367 RepID=UPI00211AD7B3|nr:FAD-dependent oxidoreductase [Caballeronia sordidicola]
METNRVSGRTLQPLLFRFSPIGGPMRTHFDAIIVGAGPAGSSAAILLARAGWSVALIEKQRFPRRKVCGECIAASNLPLLAALGIGAAIDRHAGPELRQVAFMRGDNTVVANLPAADHPKYRWGRALGRETLDTLLIEQARAAGADVWQPWSVQSIDGKPGAWLCVIHLAEAMHGLNASDRATLQAPVMIDAHGSWESLPSDRPQRGRKREPTDLLAFKANFRYASLDAGLLPVLSFDGGYGGMVVADDDVTTVAGCIRRDRLDELRRTARGVSAGEAIEAMLRHTCTGVGAVLRDASRQGSWLGAGPLNPGIRVRAKDGIFRIGNAAGEAHPIIGEGMSMALQSAWLLCVHLLEPEQKLDRDRNHIVRWQRFVASKYADDWRREFVSRIRLASVFAHAAMNPASATILTSLARTWPGLLPFGAKWGGKTRCAINSKSVKLLTSTATSNAL